MSTPQYAYPPTGFPAAGFPGYPPAGFQQGFSAFPQQQQQQQQPGVERQIIPEYVQVPVTQTVMVPQTQYQQRLIQVPVQQTIQVPRVVNESQEQSYQVPKVEYITQIVEPERTIQVPKMVMVPKETFEYQTVMKDHTIQVPKPVYETRKRTIQVPKYITEDKVIEEQVPAYEMKSHTVQVPRTVMEPQVVTAYQPQYTQEPVTVQVPMHSTQMIAQQINKVIEYKREPVNTYTVAGGYYPIGQPQFQQGAVQGQQQTAAAYPYQGSALPAQAYGQQQFGGFPYGQPAAPQGAGFGYPHF